MLPNLVIPLVWVGAKLDRTIRFGVRRPIDDENWKRARQRSPIGGAAGNTFVDRLEALAEQELRERSGVFDAYAPVAHHAIG